jgi:hypothetical protein
MIVEEVLLKKRRYPPLNVVGMEGVFGILLMVLVVLPLLYIIPGKIIFPFIYLSANLLIYLTKTSIFY